MTSCALTRAHAGAYRWTREAPLGGTPRSSGVESWQCVRADRSVRRYLVDVKIGKPFDVLGMKGTDLAETRKYAKFLAQTAGRLYGSDSTCELVTNCPACGHDAAFAIEAFRIFSVPYHRCEICGHGFVRRRPSQAALKSLFSDSAKHSDAYLDREMAERRLAQIVAPKLDWVLEIFSKAFGRRPGKAIDVGAGGGHFVAGLGRANVAAEGWELSEASRLFAKEVFGVELRGDDYVSSGADPVNLVTYWGLLEYVPEPLLLLQAARRRLAPHDGLLVVEVPRFDALGTVVQAHNPDGVARHMDPTTHINCFSDVSLMTALVKSGFEPVAAWYFGMDAYELLVQLALRTGQDDLVDASGDMIPALQASIDAGLQCDDLIVAARPVEEFAA
jgi:2-polyprenyl-3-methyl-5-hydroxy-6-metoxy-1,4-benzoquinol methylase